jgi:hypothetical protein
VFDLTARTGGRILNRRLLEALIRAGALDSLHGNRRALLDGVEPALRYGNAHAAHAASEQTSLFGGLTGHVQVPKPALPAVDDLPVLERLQQEFDALGFYLSAHPLDGYRSSLEKLGVVPADQLPACGEVRLEGDALKVLAASIERLDAVLANGGARAQTCIEVRLSDPGVAQELRDLLGPHGEGGARVRLVLPLADQEVAIDLGDGYRLALARRMDLERRAGVLRVVDF